MNIEPTTTQRVGVIGSAGALLCFLACVPPNDGGPAPVQGIEEGTTDPTGPEPEGALPEIATTASGIAAQQQDVAEIFGELDAGCTIGAPSPWCGYFSNANKTLVSYAVTKLSGGSSCTGAFIGPNLYMTAGHCGAQSITPTSITYQGTARSRAPGAGATSASRWNVGSCAFVLGSIQQNATALYRGGADVNLHYCPNVLDSHGRSVPPGLLLGDLDFDNRDVPVGEQVWRLWWNPVVAAPYNSGDHLMISRATGPGGTPVSTIQSTNTRYGYQNALSYTDSTCVNGGASGSPGLSENWLRIVEGPLSMSNVNNPGLPCGFGAKSTKTTAIFSEFYLDPNWASVQMNGTFIQSLGMQPHTYWGFQDENHNNVFDFQEDLEKIVGEVDRQYFWYNFDSARRNALWRTLAFTNVFTDHVTPPAPPFGIVHLQTDTNSTPVTAEGMYAETLFRLDSFPLKANTSYRVNLKLNVLSASGASVLQFRAGSQAPIAIPTPLGVSRATFRFTTGAQACDKVLAPGACGIRFEAVNPANSTTAPLLSADLNTLSVSKEDANRDVFFDFDTSDNRGSWRNQNTNARALILPDGISATPNGVPDFALAVTDDPARAQSVDWSALNEHLDLVPGESYTIFFRAKSTRTTGTIAGAAEAFTPSGVVLSALNNWAVGSAWSTEFALGPFVAAPDTRVHFGAFNFGANTTDHILIDQIRVHRN